MASCLFALPGYSLLATSYSLLNTRYMRLDNPQIFDKIALGSV